MLNSIIRSSDFRSCMHKLQFQVQTSFKWYFCWIFRLLMQRVNRKKRKLVDEIFLYRFLFSPPCFSLFIADLLSLANLLGFWKFLINLRNEWNDFWFVVRWRYVKDLGVNLSTDSDKSNMCRIGQIKTNHLRTSFAPRPKRTSIWAILIIVIRRVSVQKLCNMISKMIVEDLENNFQAQLIRFNLVSDKICLQLFNFIQSKWSTVVSDISAKGSPVIIKIHHHISLSDKHFFK